MTDNALRLCTNREKCVHPDGPYLPAIEFKKLKSNTPLATCSYCREALRKRKATSREKHYTDGVKTRLSRRDASKLPSNADLSPDYRESIRQWLLGLVIRRAGHPFTREISEEQTKASQAAPAPKIQTCTRCGREHATHYKMCQTCREKGRVDIYDRRKRQAAV